MMNKLLEMRLDLWFSLSVKQRSKLEKLDIFHWNVEHCSMSDFLKVTKNKVLREKLIEIKRSSMRLVG